MSLFAEIEQMIADAGGSDKLANLLDVERKMDYYCTKKDCYYCRYMRELHESLMDNTQHEIENIEVKTIRVRSIATYPSLYSLKNNIIHYK